MVDAVREKLRQRARDEAQAGFSLIEILVAVAVLAILGAALSPLAVQHVRRARSDATIEEMERIFRGMIGQPLEGQFGFVGDMGILPANINELVDPSGQPAFVNFLGVGFGWNGPYVQQIGSGNDLATDAWGSAYVWNPAIPQLQSRGADRQLGTADDLVIPSQPASSTGNMVITVNGYPLSGGIAEPLNAACIANIIVFSSNGGVLAAELAEQSVGNENNFTWEVEDIHMGPHIVWVIGENKYTGAGAIVVEETVQGTNAINVAIREQNAGGDCAP